jgi:hypothetical protein
MSKFDSIPPGILFLVKRLPQLLYPPGTTFILLYLYRNLVDSPGIALPLPQPPTWLIVTMYILSFPTALILSNVHTAVSNRIAAARMGAVMLPTPPFMDDPTPGGLLSLWRGIKSFKNGYPGTC